VCTVMLRHSPGEGWPLLLAAVRDEFMRRSWDPPGAHWPHRSPSIVGGRDRTAGGTWLALRRDRPAVAALLNGVRLPQQERPTRGGLPLAALTDALPTPDELREYDGFHLLLGTPEQVRVWSWDGAELTTSDLTPGDHIIVNLGVDTVDDPLVPHFAPLLSACPSPQSLREAETAAAWDGWVDLLRGDGLDPDDARALIERREVAGDTYGSTSASLIALGRDAARFDFTATPEAPDWGPVELRDG
jgi:hypothetical protein